MPLDNTQQQQQPTTALEYLERGLERIRRGRCKGTLSHVDDGRVYFCMSGSIWCSDEGRSLDVTRAAQEALRMLVVRTSEISSHLGLCAFNNNVDDEEAVSVFEHVIRQARG